MATAVATTEATQAEEAPAKRGRGRAAATGPAPAPVNPNFGPNGEIFTRYAVTLRFREKIMGGTPKRADVIEAWIRKGTGVTDQEELRQMTRRTLMELGNEVPENATLEDMIAASKALAVERNTNGFKTDATTGQLMIETRQVKAALKECTNILYAGQRWGATYKGPKNFLAERVFVEGDVITLGVAEPSGIEMIIGHVTGPQGEKSTLTYHEYVRRATVGVVVYALGDCITQEQWSAIWQLAQENGIGALRSQGHGRFDVTDIVRLREKKAVGFAIRDEA